MNAPLQQALAVAQAQAQAAAALAAAQQQLVAGGVSTQQPAAITATVYSSASAADAVQTTTTTSNGQTRHAKKRPLDDAESPSLQAQMQAQQAAQAFAAQQAAALNSHYSSLLGPAVAHDPSSLLLAAAVLTVPFFTLLHMIRCRF